MRRSSRTDALLFLFLLYCGFLLAQAAFDAQFAYGFNQSTNNRNVSVDTQVNITGSRPEIIAVFLADPITLAAGSLQVVTCNLTVRDYNGFADIDAVNATFFQNPGTALTAADDNNTHYTNTSCALIAGQQGGFYSNYSCSFALSYYAVNGTWNCTGVANDTSGFLGNGSRRTNISALFALNVTPLIDYGNLSILDTSANVSANVTNLGNRPINISVLGYGRNLSDGLSFMCEFGNVSVGAQRFAANSTALYAEKQNLTSAYQQIPGLTVQKPTDNAQVRNATYWQLYLGPNDNANGLCNGTIVFQAENGG